MKTIIIAVAMVLMVAITIPDTLNFSQYLTLAGWIFIWSLMVVEFVNSLRRKPKPEPDWKQMYFKANAKVIELNKEVNKLESATHHVHFSNNDKETIKANLSCAILKAENNRLTAKVVELTDNEKKLIDKVNGYRGAFKSHKKGGVK